MEWKIGAYINASRIEFYKYILHLTSFTSLEDSKIDTSKISHHSIIRIYSIIFIKNLHLNSSISFFNEIN